MAIYKTSCTLILLLTANCYAAEHDQHNFSLNIGNFVTESGLNFRLDSDLSGTGTPINFEEDLGLDKDEIVIRIDGHYLFNHRHRIDFSYFDLSRNASRTIDQTIQYGDEIFNINTTVNSSFNTSIYKLGYSYFFYRENDINLGALAGLYIMDISASISATSTSQSEAANTTAPLPVIGLRAEYGISDRINLRASYEYFSLNPDDDFDGRLADIYLAIEYQFYDHIALGLAYNKVDFDVNITDKALQLDTDWAYDGYIIYVGARY